MFGPLDDWVGGFFGGKSYADSKVNPNLETFRNSANDYKNGISSNTGENAYNKSLAAGEKETAGLADQLTQKQANGAAAQALGAARTAGHTKGRTSRSAENVAANTYANLYGQNYQTQLNQQNNLMNAYSQQLANNQNALGTLMSANLNGDQAQYNQNWNNNKQASKMQTGILGNVMDAISDEKLKDKVNVGIDGNEDCRMARYKRAGEKLKRMNPNKWKELHWEGK